MDLIKNRFIIQTFIASLLIALLIPLAGVVNSVAASESYAIKQNKEVTIKNDPPKIAVRLIGTVASVSNVGNQVSEWILHITNEHRVTVIINEDVKLPDNVPQLRQRVQISGILRPDLAIQALELKLYTGDDSNSILVELSGTVIAHQLSDNGSGIWMIRTFLGVEIPISLTMITTSNTRFGDELPKVEQQILIWGALKASGQIVASSVRLVEDENDSDVDITGQVFSAPRDQQGIGVWIVRVGEERVYVVEAVERSEFKGGIPVQGQIVRIKGKRRATGSILASSFEVDEAELIELTALRPIQKIKYTREGVKLALQKEQK
ncbi:hypothetical protein KFU94_55455 [Chloroflexi bacterium TSY]|nr:hypothetical protein [Chloroflexi bacterium TSY]